MQNSGHQTSRKANFALCEQTRVEGDVTAPSVRVVPGLLVYWPRAGCAFMQIHANLLFLPPSGTVGPLPL